MSTKILLFSGENISFWMPKCYITHFKSFCLYTKFCANFEKMRKNSPQNLEFWPKLVHSAVQIPTCESQIWKPLKEAYFTICFDLLGFRSVFSIFPIFHFSNFSKSQNIPNSRLATLFKYTPPFTNLECRFKKLQI